MKNSLMFLLPRVRLHLLSGSLCFNLFSGPFRSANIFQSKLRIVWIFSSTDDFVPSNDDFVTSVNKQFCCRKDIVALTEKQEEIEAYQTQNFL